MSSANSSETIEDIVILGRAAPEELSDGRRTACTGAWSENRGFIRLYPIRPELNDLFHRWDVVDVDVEENPQDTRDESWKLKENRGDQTSCVTHTGKYPRNKRATLLSNLEDDCVRDINEAGRSLGIVRPETKPKLQFREWGDEDTFQSRLFEEEWRPDVRDQFEHEIRVEFTCSNCRTKQGYHNKTLLEWGAYLGKRKHDVQIEEELEAYYDLDDDDYNHWVFVGNQHARPSSFIAINLIWTKAAIHSSVFDSTTYRKVADDFESRRPE